MLSLFTDETVQIHWLLLLKLIFKQITKSNEDFRKENLKK
jgi:hypothetical protein